MNHIRRAAYIDRAGRCLTVGEWSRLFEDHEYRRIRESSINGYWISTVWRGYVDGTFETMILDSLALFDGERWQFATEAEAIAGHERAVAIAASVRWSNRMWASFLAVLRCFRPRL
jgi:hypothetical protein